jgi:hypothetical protein
MFLIAHQLYAITRRGKVRFGRKPYIWKKHLYITKKQQYSQSLSEEIDIGLDKQEKITTS